MPKRRTSLRTILIIDSYILKPDVQVGDPGVKDVSLFSVFDGHGGRFCIEVDSMSLFESVKR